MQYQRVRAVILYNHQLVCIKRVKENEIYYVLPGGGVEGQENHFQALTRECTEELSVTVDIKNLIFERVFNNQQEFFYVCSINSGELGHGHGPEFQSNSVYEGDHLIELVNLSHLNDIDLKPTELKDIILSLHTSYD